MKETNFKDTEIGLVPFDWDVVKLKTFLTLLTDYDANGSFQDMADNVKTFVGRGYAWYVRATDLEQQSKMSEVRYVDEKSYRFLRKSSLFGGEVLLAKRGEIGKVYYFKKKTQFATLAPNLYLLKLSNKIDSKWLYYFFLSQKGQELLKSINASTSLGAIYKEDVKNLNVFYLSIKEQTHIATALSDIDSLIQKNEELLEKKRNIKQGTMQQLLTGKKRLKGFTGEWVEKKLECISMQSGQMLKSDEYEYGNIPVIAGGKNPAGYHNKYNRKSNTITISGSGASAGYVAFYEKPIYATDCSTINESKDFDIKFLYYSLVLRQNEIYKCQAGGAQPHIHYKDIKDIPICYPLSKSEQAAVATILSDMDKEIEEIEQKLVKLRDIKQGMMQQLLTGKIRLV